MHHRLLIVLMLISSLGFAQETWDLQRCVQHALENNLQVKQSELNLELNEINQQRNLGTFLPTLNASASHGYNWGQTIDPFTNQFATERIRSNSFGIGTNLTIFNGFQNLNSYKQGLTNIEGAKADLDALKNDIALNVANSYLNVLFNQELLKIAESNVEATQDQADRIQKLVDAGAAPEGNAFDIQSQLATDQASLVTADNNLRLAKLALVQLLQLDANQANNINIVSPDLGNIDALALPPSSQDAIINAVANFPQMRSARIDAESAAQGLDVAKGTRYPNLTLNFNYGTGFSGNNRIPVGDPVFEGDQIIGIVEGDNTPVLAPIFGFEEFETKPFGDQLTDNINSSLFFRLNIPIFNGFNSKSSVEQAQVQVLQAEYALEQSEQQLTQEIERAYADAIAAYNNYTAAEIALNAAETAFNYATVRYEAGASNIADYTNVRVRRDNAQANLIRNKYDYVFRIKVMEFYMGKGLSLK